MTKLHLEKVLTGIAFAISFGGMAETTAIWTSTNARITTDSWGQPELWTDAAGTALTVAPTNSADGFNIRLKATTTDLIPPETKGWLYGEKHVKQITTGANSGVGSSTAFADGAVNPVIRSIAGETDIADTHRYAIFQAPFVKQTVFPLLRSFSVRDPNNFRGLFKSDNANVTWEFLAEADFTPEAYAIDTRYAPHVKVPTAGTTAKVSGVSRAGGVYKDGAGTLEVEGGGSDAHYIVTEGTLRLNGGGATEDALVKNLLSEALLHLDASDSLSVTLSNDTAHAWITRWDDVRKNGVWAYPDPHDTVRTSDYVSAPNPAFVSVQTSPTGLRLADFGRNAVDGAADADPGVTNCYLRLSTAFTTVRDAVFVAAFPYGTANATMLGHTSYYDWISDGTYGRLFSCGYDPYAVAYGKFAVNGGPCTYDDLREGSTDWTAVNVIHAQPNSDTRVNLLGTDRIYASRHGNFRVGEILLFNRELTFAERNALDRYLVTKWLDGEERSAVGVLLEGNAALDVPAGTVARVGRVSATNETVVKTGAGTLEVTEIATTNQTFDIRGGSVRFAACPTMDLTRPGGTPAIWLDASEDATLVTGDTGVTEWKDCRDDTLVATAASGTTVGTLPAKIAAGCNGLQTLDFGTGDSTAGSQSYVKLPNGTAADTYAGFMVLKFKNIGSYFMFGSGNGNITFFRSQGTIGAVDATGMGRCYMQREVAAAYWSINGTQRSPVDTQSELLDTSEYFVIGFKSAVPLVCNRIASDRDNINPCGNIEVGEFITYHTPISADAFRQTEAYLMKKWLNRTHPANGTTLGAVTFASGLDPVIDTDRDLTLALPEAGLPSLTKKGTGTLTLTLKPWTSVPSVQILGGDVRFVYDDGLNDEALFRFDASDLSAIDYTVENDVTNVITIADVRQNGIRGRSALDAGFGPANRHPQLKSVETKPGFWRPVLDFFNPYYKGDSTQDGTALLLQKDETDHIFTNVREVFFIIAENADTAGLKCNSWFSATFGTGSALKWGRNSYNDPDTLIGATFTKYAYPGFFTDGSATVDGVTGKATELTIGSADGFKLVELRPGEDAAAAVFAAERKDYAVGGYKLGEMVAFPRELTTSERTYLRQSLRAKWFGENYTPATPAAVTLTLGETLSISGVTIPETMSITVNIPADAEEGVYTLISSDRGFVSAEPPGNMTINNQSRRVVTRVWIDGTALKLQLARRGLTIIVK